MLANKHLTYGGVRTKVTDAGTQQCKLLKFDLYLLSLEIGRFVIMGCVCVCVRARVRAHLCFVPRCLRRLSLSKGLPLLEIADVLSKAPFLEKHFMVNPHWDPSFAGCALISHWDCSQFLHCLFESFSHQPAFPMFFL